MEESRTHKIKKNVISSVLQNVINLLVSFGGRIIFIMILDDSYLGINGLFTNVLSILSLADLGIGTVMMYHLYRPIAENNIDKIKVLIRYFKKAYLLISIVILVIGVALIPFLKYIINLPQEMPQVYLYYMISLMNVSISYLFVYRTMLVSADQKSYILNNCVIAFKFITFAVQVTVLILFKSYLIYLTAALITNFACNLYQNHIAVKLYPFISDLRNAPRPEKDLRRDIFINIKALFLYKICGTIQSNTDSILTSIFCGTIYVGYYSNYILILNQIVSFLSILFNSLKASVGNLLASEDKDSEKKWELFKTLELFNFWGVSLLTICFLTLANDFMIIGFGKEYLLTTDVVIAISLNFYTNNIRQTIWTFRETSGMFEPMKYIPAVTAFINLVSSIILGRVFGMFGIIIATVISRMLYAWWKEPQLLFRNYFNKSPKIYYVTYFRRVGLFVVMSLIVYYSVGAIIITNKIVEFLAKGTVSILLVNLMLFIVYYKSPEFNYLKSHLLNHKLKN